MSIFFVLHTPVTSAPKDLCNLHCERTHTTRRAMDQYLLPRLDFPLRAETLQGGDRRHRQSCCLLEGHILRHQYQCTFTSTDVFGKPAPTTPGEIPEYIIARLEILYVTTDSFNPTRDI